MTEETAVNPVTKRNGACVATVCSTGCQAYAYSKKADGYETCVCGHTRWAHAITD